MCMMLFQHTETFLWVHLNLWSQNGEISYCSYSIDIQLSMSFYFINQK